MGEGAGTGDSRTRGEGIADRWVVDMGILVD